MNDLWLDTAVQLVRHAYDTRDRDVWSGPRALTFWDRLPDRVRTACYAGPTLGHWWEGMARQLGSGAPYRAETRAALAELLNIDSRPVLDILRSRAEEVCLRVRVLVQADRDDRAAEKSEVSA